MKISDPPIVRKIIRTWIATTVIIGVAGVAAFRFHTPRQIAIVVGPYSAFTFVSIVAVAILRGRAKRQSFMQMRSH